LTTKFTDTRIHGFKLDGRHSALRKVSPSPFPATFAFRILGRSPTSWRVDLPRGALPPVDRSSNSHPYPAASTRRET
jgi:hypothetical protein